MTRRDLLRLRAALLVLTAAVFACSFAVFSGVRSTVQNAGTNTAPAVLEVLAARSALVRADAAAMTSFQPPQVQLIGLGEQYQSELALASQSLTQVAEHNAAGDEASRRLQLVDGLLVAYSGSIARAEASFRPDERNPLGLTELWDASRLLHQPDSGILAQLDELAAAERAALARQLSTGWMSTPALLLWVVPIVALFSLLLLAQWYLRRRFRRTVNLALLAATVLLLLVAATASTSLVSQSRAAAAAGTLDQVSGGRQAQAAAIAATGRHALGDVLRIGCGEPLQGGCGGTVNAFLAGLPPMSGAAPSPAGPEAEGATQVIDEFAAAEMAEITGVLGYFIPLGAAAVAALIFLGLQSRLDEYRYRPT